MVEIATQYHIAVITVPRHEQPYRHIDNCFDAQSLAAA